MGKKGEGGRCGQTGLVKMMMGWHCMPCLIRPKLYLQASTAKLLSTDL